MPEPERDVFMQKTRKHENFYENSGFEPFPVDPLKLMPLIKNARAVFLFGP
jgi:hypothetical protein